jgi:hypothetical protein
MPLLFEEDKNSVEFGFGDLAGPQIRVNPERRQQRGSNDSRYRFFYILNHAHVHFSDQVALRLGLDDFPCWMHCGSEFWSLDMAERQELPDDVPCGANCLESGLRHASIKSACLAFLTSLLCLPVDVGRMLCVLCNAMCIGKVIHDDAP